MLLSPARRHRRPLLFPPGLLALGFLLLLGCLALRPWYKVLGPYYVIQLTLPSRPVSDFIFAYPNSLDFRWRKIGSVELISSNDKLKLYSQLPYLRPWQDFTFTGDRAHDVAMTQKAQLAFQAMQADTMHARGIRIRFAEQAVYANLVQSLDWANFTTEGYFLDVHHAPTTLYAFTNAYRPPDIADNILYPDASISLGCFLCNDVIYSIPPPAPFEVQIQKWLTRWHVTWQQAIFSSPWQLPLVFLLGIVAVNCWKMARRWHTA